MKISYLEHEFKQTILFFSSTKTNTVFKYICITMNKIMYKYDLYLKFLKFISFLNK